MILGIGCDIVNINRIKTVFSSMEKKKRIFSDAEISLCCDNYEKLAGRFAVKEAVIKAMDYKKIPLKKIETVNTPTGKPILSQSCLEEIYRIFPKVRINISISHEREYAIAYVVMETIDEK